MKKFFAQLRPGERRLAVGVLVIFILVLNWWYVWPHFSDLKRLENRMATAKRKLALYNKGIAEKPKYEALVKKYEGTGEFVAPDEQAINFMREVQTQAAASSVGIARYSPQSTQTNPFFIEKSQGINVVATDGQLVDFLYKLGSSASMVRVRDLEMQPDGARQHLNANIQLVASYQKKPPAPAPAAQPKIPAKKEPATAKATNGSGRIHSKPATVTAK